MARRKKAKSRKGRGGSRKRRTTKRRSTKGRIPLKVLEKRLSKLNKIVKSRGGSAL